MSGKLAIGGLVAVAVMALSAETASAQYIVRHGNHYHSVSPGFGYSGFGGGYGGGFYQPVYRPVVVNPYGGFPSYGYGGGYARPVYGGGFYGGGFGPGVGIGFNNGFYSRPSFGLSFNFIR